MFSVSVSADTNVLRTSPNFSSSLQILPPSLDIKVGDLNWINFYHKYNIYNEITEEASLSGLSLSFPNKSLQSDNLPLYQYPVNSVNKVELQNNKLSDLSFFPNSFSISGPVNLENSGISNVSELVRVSAFNEKLNISYNPLIKSISELSSLNFNKPSTGAFELYLDPPQQYTEKLISGLSLCDKIASGDVKVRSNNETLMSYDDYCSISTDWIGMYHKFNIYNNATDDSELFNSYVVFREYNGLFVTDEDIPNTTYPASRVDGITVYKTELTNIDFLSSISSSEYINIDSNANLTQINGLSNITTSRYASITINNNPLLEDITVLSGFTSIKGSLKIKNSPSIKTLKGLENISPIDSLIIIGNDSLSNINAIENLIVKGQIHVVGNPSLTDISPLSNVDFSYEGTGYQNIYLYLDMPEQYTTKMDKTGLVCQRLTHNDRYKVVDAEHTLRQASDYCR